MLPALLRHQLEIATTASSGGVGEVTLQVLHGRIALVAGPNRWSGTPGDLLFIPDSRHALEAAEDSVVLLTVAKRS
jgi:quercetin dioxygenase-like cupin family protein